MEAQPYKRFRDKVWDHLASYVIDTYGDSVIKGEWHGKPTSHRHILRIDDEPKVEIIRKYNLLKSAQIEPFLLSKPHNEAHHLNSSQIMCYNFFRPQLNADGFVQKPLKDLLNSIIGSTYGEGKACFEYIDHNSEEKKGKTNYDFYVNFEDMKVFFEIKYTENKFDHCKINDGHFEYDYVSLFCRVADKRHGGAFFDFPLAFTAVSGIIGARYESLNQVQTSGALHFKNTISLFVTLLMLEKILL